MNKHRSIMVVILLMATSLTRAAFAVRQVRTYRALNLKCHECDRPLTTPQDSETRARVNAFATIWRARTRKNITGQILPFLTDPFPALRVRAVQALGELEDPKAQKPLQALLTRMEGSEGKVYEAGGIPVITLKLALARIASRDTLGKAKVVGILQRVGLSWSDLVQLTQKVDGPERVELQMTDSPSLEIVNTVVQVLYSMGKRGQNADVLAKQLKLTPAQQVYIKGSTLKPEQEIKLILDFLLEVHVVGSDDNGLVQHLVSLGPRATSAILRHLQEMKENPQRYSGSEAYPGRPGASWERMGYANLFQAAAQTRDSRMIPLLKVLERNSNRRISQQATAAREFIERQ